MADRITREDVEHVARLSRLALTEREADELASQLGVILDHAQDLSELDLTGVPPTAHPLAMTNVVRADEVRPGVDRDEILAQAPAAEDGQFRVPRILDAP